MNFKIENSIILPKTEKYFQKAIDKPQNRVYNKRVTTQKRNFYTLFAGDAVINDKTAKKLILLRFLGGVWGRAPYK